LKNLEQRAQNQALNVRNQFLSRAKQEKDKIVNTALNEARNAIQTSLSDMKNNMTNKSVNNAKNASSTPNNKSGEQREKLLNQSLEKIRNQGLQSPGELNPQPPNSTQFFDTKGQLLNFAGPSLGGSLGGL
jgi:vacuolar-type H+-ATPase subunit H